MKAFVLEAAREVPVIRDWPEPPDPSTRVVCAGLNPVDLAMAGPRFDDYLPFPRVLGMEAVVEHDGHPYYCEVTSSPWGSFAERTVVEADALIPLPPGLDAPDAVALGVAGLAGWLSVDLAHVRAGEKVAVLGATGAVGQIAVQRAAMAGANVVGVGRHQPTLEDLIDLGASEVVSLDNIENRDSARDVDVIIACVKHGLRAVAGCATTAGRVVDIGAPPRAVRAAGDSALAEAPHLKVLPFNNFDFEPHAKRAAFSEMASLVLSGHLKVNVEQVPLEKATDAWRRQARSPHRKLALVP